MNEQIKLVKRFYQEIWNRHYSSSIPELLHEQLTFRGSLGDIKSGHIGFIEYLDKVHAALGDYRCDIEELVQDSRKVFAKMRFGGLHRGNLLGYPGSGRRVSWEGAALFFSLMERSSISGYWATCEVWISSFARNRRG